MKITKVLAVLAMLSTSLFIVTPATHAAAGDMDQYLALNGTSQYASNSTASTLNSFNAISIEFWVYSRATTCAGNLIARQSSFAVYCAGGGNINYALQGAGSWSGVDTGFYLPANEWHHIALTRIASTTSSAVKVYFDGVLIYTGSADGAGTSALSANASAFNIGARNNVADLNALIDEVRISNVVRTQSEIQTDMYTWGIGSETGVVAYYDFNDVSGSTVYNKIPNAPSDSNLTLNGSPTLANLETTTFSSGKAITTFKRSYLTANGGWKVPSNVSSLDVLIVGGGGAGGSRAGGGGGAGGYVYTTNLSTTGDAFESITVGSGGISFIGGRSTNGTTSGFGGRRFAVGGGGGGAAAGSDNTFRAGADGGSGGGATGDYSTAGSSAAYGYATQSTTYGYGVGFRGGSGINNNTSWSGGGGGGAASVGVNGTYLVAGNGGSGLIDPIGGTTTCYAGGGGGGTNSGYTPGAAGTCAGGTTTAGVGTAGSSNTGVKATANSGSGGGGTGYSGGADVRAGAGGSGVVIVKYTYINPISGPSIGTSTATYRVINALTATSATAARVSFYFQGKLIAGCRNVLTTGSGTSFTATCSWKPSLHGPNLIKAVITPTDSNISAGTVSASIPVAARSNNR